MHKDIAFVALQPMQKILVVQTAFLGDVVLATALLEKLRAAYPDARLDFVLRRGNESLLQGHPYLGRLWIWDKKKNKTRNLLRLALQLRRQRYDWVINLQRFASSGLLTALTGAARRSGFDKNPLSFLFTHTAPHRISEPYSPDPVHEVTRNQQLIAAETGPEPALPALYPSESDYKHIKAYVGSPYICIAPSSVWFTKQFPPDRWATLCNLLPEHYTIYLLGGPGDHALAESVRGGTHNPRVLNLCGRLSLLQSAALMQGAEMNYVNDSAPLHCCTATAAPVTVVYCSTVPAFGFGPMRENGRVVEIKERLYCRPCGLHGRKACPEGHFRCARDITNDQLLWWISKTT